MSRGKRLIGVGDLAGEVMEALKEYEGLCEEEVKATVKEVAKEAVKELKSESPAGTGSRKGHYKDGWKYSVDKDSAYKIGVTVHNSKKPGVAHLLEKGHARRGGGRDVKAIVHIAPVEEKVAKDYEKRLKEKLSK
jgi:hypothetical protein|nr:MAG TPA: putative tail component [Caudoviricetes sp.]